MRIRMKRIVSRGALLVFLLAAAVPAAPAARAQEATSLNPQEAVAGTDLDLVLEGTGLDNLGQLTDVVLGNFPLEILDYNIESSRVVWIYVWIPDEAPPGEQVISIVFEERGFDFYFLLHEPASDQPGADPVLYDFFPREAAIGDEPMLTLEGENLPGFGRIEGVAIGGVEVPVLWFDYESAEVMLLQIRVTDDVGIGEQEITFFFEGAAVDGFFAVANNPVVPIPTEQVGPGGERDLRLLLLIAFLGLGVLGTGAAALLGGIFIFRRLGRRPRVSEPGREPPPPAARITFRSRKDFGVQDTYPVDRPLRPDFEIGVAKRIELVDLKVKPLRTSEKDA